MVFVSEVLAAGSVDVQRITSGPWLEDTVTFNAQPSLSGSSDGGGPVDVTAALKGTYLVFDVTELVQDWVDSPATNFGVALVGSDNVNMRFLSKESQTPGAILDITLYESGGAGAAGPAGPAGPAGAAGPAGPTGDTGPAGPLARLVPRARGWPVRLVPRRDGSAGPRVTPVRLVPLARLVPLGLRVTPVRLVPLARRVPLGPLARPVRLARGVAGPAGPAA